MAKVELPSINSGNYYKAYKSLGDFLRGRGIEPNKINEQRLNDMVYGMAVLIEAQTIGSSTAPYPEE